MLSELKDLSGRLGEVMSKMQGSLGESGDMVADIRKELGELRSRIDEHRTAII